MLTFAAVKQLLARFWPVAVGALVVAILLLAYCEGKDAGRSDAERSRLEGNVEALEDKGRADEKAAETRLQDAERANAEQTELKEAVTDAKATGGDPRRAYYDCLAKLQQARKSGGSAPTCG